MNPSADEIQEVKKMLANPFYCLRTIHAIFSIDHEPLVSEEQFIKSGVMLIEQYGAEEYLRLLLDNLKGGGGSNGSGFPWSQPDR